jgi:hypothetical protein
VDPIAGMEYGWLISVFISQTRQPVLIILSIPTPYRGDLYSAFSISRYRVLA